MKLHEHMCLHVRINPCTIHDTSAFLHVAYQKPFPIACRRCFHICPRSSSHGQRSFTETIFSRKRRVETKAILNASNYWKHLMETLLNLIRNTLLDHYLEAQLIGDSPKGAHVRPSWKLLLYIYIYMYMQKAW
eukprot:jgi/Botrbrau1/19487/Bobra.0749s0003.2